MIVLEILLKIAAFLILFAVFYSLLTLFGTLIPRHRRFLQATESGIDIFLVSNGVHTDFVLPIKNELQDWWQIIDKKDYELGEKAKFMGFGWGDKGFYLDTPTWAELKFSTACKALFIPSPTLMHITAHENLPIKEKFFEKISINAQQYQYLCNYIVQSFYWDKAQQLSFVPSVGYTNNDNFYKAIGVYHLFNTCNFWVNKGLIKIGVRTPLWSPLDRGIFYQLKKQIGGGSRVNKG
jgi:uncharacterized protein (TIGR02117 family)